MIRFLTHEQVDLVKWDDCIDRSANGTIYAYSWYLDIVSPGWCALVEEEYRSVMPLPAKQKLKTQYLIQPLFAQQLGIFSPELVSSRDVKEFLHKIPLRYKYIDINLNEGNKIETSSLNHNFNVNYLLNLDQPYENLEASFKENLMRNLRKADKSNFDIVKDVDPKEVIELFRLNRGAGIRNWKDPQYEILEVLLKQLIGKQYCEIWGVRDEQQKLMGGVCWVLSHQKAIFLFSAISDQGRQSGVMPLIIRAFIREHAGKNMILDFEGSNDANLGRFYASFGARKVFYPRVKSNYLPWTLRLALKVYRYFRDFRKNK